MIRTEKLTKRYGKKEAITDLSIEINPGQVFGFIGPNGAGKTTTMMILSTLLAPTSGTAYIDGHNVLTHPREVRQLIGYMPDFFGVYDRLITTEYLDFYAGAYHIPNQKRPALIQDLLELVNLSNKAEAYVDALSRGMKQRLGLARCLIHNPKVLILDEPASGLDPRARIEMREILKELKRLGKTIMISSHILPELAHLCDSIGVIEKGKMIAHGPVDKMGLGEEELRMLRIKVLGELEQAEQVVQTYPGVKQIHSAHRELRITFAGGEEEQARLLCHLLHEGITVVDFGTEKENLEDVFLSITQGVGN